ncbi:DUF3806 domain-containing protein [Ruminiclostridium cellobioparum]|uniref:DUF3806 domain-containing protein n=1 Tax=Ruminiclostridium cellobioparum subsp. termitidis CT1112 TaxID=1195236 RepID=S0FH75_RUMCE|nr:DUF3806 domain-containing protein [Ruminiclostridium cellobioparum]EMS69181.1 hypothetical protein CTER_5229 [Ruminiclostridium cellobioparum subsp. termitidis CT1112]
MGDVLNSIDKLSEKAVQYAREFSKNLDYSESSIGAVEEILEYYHNDLKGHFIKNILRKIKKEAPTDSQIWSMATIWGVYIGEVICKNSSNRCKWVYEDEFGTGAVLHIKVDNNNRVYPIDKAFKRLKNGPEDNVVSFYEVFKKMVLTGNFPQDQ